MNKRELYKRLRLILPIGILFGVGLTDLQLIQAKIPTTEIIIINVATLVMLAIIVILTLLYTRKNYEEENIAEAEKIAPQIKDSELNSFKQKMITLLKIGAIPAIGLIPFLIYDASTPAAIIEKSLVIHKQLNRGKGAYADVRVKDIESDRTYDAESDRALYNLVQDGDTLVIHKTRRFGLWQLVEVYRGDRIVGNLKNVAIGGPIIIIIMLFIPGLIFLFSKEGPMFEWVDNYQLGIWISVPVIELLSVLLWIMLFVVNNP